MPHGPTPPPDRRWRETALGVIGVAVFVAIPAVWIALVLLRHFGIVPAR